MHQKSKRGLTLIPSVSGCRKCTCLFPRTENIYSSRDHFNDGVGDNPAYEPTPQSSAASSVGGATPNKSLEPNGKHIGFTEPASSAKRGFLNRAFGSKPPAKSNKPQGNNVYFSDSSGKGNPEKRFPMERYDTPPESFDPSIFPPGMHPTALSPDTDPNMNKVHEPMQRTSAPPGSQDRPLAVRFPDSPSIPPDTHNSTQPHVPSDVMNSPVDVSRQPQPASLTAPQTRPTVARPYVAHPDYPHYGNLAPPFNVSADSIIYMDRDELDDFFLRQNRKPQIGFVPDPDKDFTPMITKLYQPETFQPSRNPMHPDPPPVPPKSSFSPVQTHPAPADLPGRETARSPDRDLASPGSSQFASPFKSPVHGPVSSITSTPSHASGYMTPPETVLELRRSSASPHLDSFSAASKTVETDV